VRILGVEGEASLREGIVDLVVRGAVDMAIAVLRKKLEVEPAKPTVIVSVKGAGYAWRRAR
jgi:DNA-binding response OmpR family regulator